MATSIARPVITVSEIAEELGMTRQTLHQAFRSLGIRPTLQLRNGTWLFFEDEVPALVGRVLGRERKRSGGRPRK